MVSFAQPLFWQIRYLITGLSKKNYKSSVSELHHLIGLYGYDAQVFFLRTLIEEIQFQDAKHGGGGRDQLKAQLLQSELKEIENEEQFGAVLCQAVEASRDGVLNEDFAGHLCKVAKLQLRPQLSLGVACLQSSVEATRREGAKFLRTKLKEYTSPGGRMTLSEPLLHSLLAALRSPAVEEVLDERDRDGISKQLMDLHPDINMSHSPCAGLVHLQRMSPSRLARHEKHTVITDLPLLVPGGDASTDGAPLDGVRACDLLEELGRGVGGNTQAVRDVLSLFPGMGARGLAEIICMTVRTTGAHIDPHSHLVAGVLMAAVRHAWNDLGAPNFNQVEGSERGLDGDATGIIQAVKECTPEAPWAEAFELVFDLADLQLSDKNCFLALLSAHSVACEGASFPLASVFKVRRNTSAQLHFLRHAANAEASQLDFASLVHPAIEPVPGLPGAEDAERIGGPNHCWACCPFIEVLFELAEAEDFGAVSELFDIPLSSSPEALFLSICLTEDRSRGALRSELLERLVPILEDGSPHSTLVQATLAERAPAQFKQLFRSMLERNPERNLSKIMDILQKDELVSFYAGLLNGPPTELSCQLALLGSNRGAMSLASWLRETISEHRDVAALGFVRFLKVRLQPPAPSAGQVEPGRFQGPYLPAGVDEQTMCKTYLDALQEASLSAETSHQVRELAQMAHEKFPSLAPAPPPEAPPAAPGPPPTAPPPGPPPANPLSAEDLEESSNGYFSRIYTGEMTVPQLIEVMRDFAAHERGSWKHEVYSRMIQNLFDECRFFPKYPPQELTTTGELFGLLINHDLVYANNLGLALRCVLEAMRRPMHTKMFRFGIIALEQFLEKLPVWPQLCHHLTQIEHLAEAYPAYVDFAKAVLKALPEDLRHATTLKPETLQGFTLPRPPPKSTQPTQPQVAASTPGSAPEVAPLGTLPSQPPPKPPTAAAPKPPAGAPPAGPPPPPSSAPEGAPPPPLRASTDSVLPPSPSGASKSSADARPEAIGARAKVSAASATATGTGSAPGSGAPAAAANPAAAAVGGTLMFGGAHTVDTLLNDPELQIEKPPMWVCDMTAAIFNSLVKDNMDQKVEEMRGMLQPEWYPWLAYYLVKSRASKEVNFHATYIDFFERLKQPRLFEMVTNMTYDCLRVLLKSVDQAVVSTSHRTVLKNLGYWLGQITLARNKSLKSKQMDLKNALLDAYENGRLTAVLPLVCKVLEGIQKSKVYKLPNPWTTAVMSLLAEIHDVPNLRTNLMFEVEVLCKHLEIKISDLKRSELLTGKRPPPSSNDLSSSARQPSDGKAEVGAGGVGGAKPGADGACSGRASDGNGGSAGGPLLRGDASAWPGGLHGDGAKDDDAPRGAGAGRGGLGQGGYHGYAGGDPLMPLLPSVGGLGGAGPDRGVGGHAGASGPGAGPHGSMPGASHHEDFITPQLPQLVTINPSISLFQVQPSIRTLVPHAVDRAIKEVVSAVVERSVTISCLTTREMVTKDFAMEPDEGMLKKAAQLMVSSVAGSLALVTCREPLRVSLTNHLWQLLAPHVPTKDSNDSAVLEQVVHVLSTDNLELGCTLIEKAVVDKALKDIEESIAPALKARQEHRVRNPTVPYYDAAYIQSNSKWPQALPDMLRPKPGPLSSQQLKVYKDFNSISPGGPPLGMAGVPGTTAGAPTAPPQEPPPFLPPQSAPHPGVGLGVGPAGSDTLSGGSAAGGARLGYGPSEGLPDFDLSPSPRTRAAGSLQLSSDSTSGLLLDDMRLGKAEVPVDVQAALTTLVNSMEQVLQGLLNNPPLLPPIDAANINNYKQDDALEACTALAMLPLDHELVNLLRQIPHWLSQCSHAETCALDLAQRIFKRLYEVPQSVSEVHSPDTVSLMHATMEVYLSVLDMLRDLLKDRLVKVLLGWVDEVSGMQRYNVEVISGLLRYQLIGLPEFDRTLAKWIESRPRDAHSTINAPAVDFAVMLLQRTCLRQRVLPGTDFAQTAEALLRESAKSRQYQQLQMATPISPQEAQLTESASKVIEELRTTEPPTAGAPRQAVSTRLAERLEKEQHRQQRGAGAEPTVSRDLILSIFEEWHSLNDASPDSLQGETRRAGGQIYTAVLQRIDSGGCIRGEEATERFFRTCCEHAVQRSLSEMQQGSGDDEGRDRQGEDQQEASDQVASSMNWAAIDSFTRLILLLMKAADKAEMLTRALAAIGQELMKDAAVKERQFNQRPYFRILLNLLMDVNSPDPNFEHATFQLLSAFCNAFHACNPLRVPNFAFAWLELISNRMFMPKLLMVKQQRGWLMFQRLLIQLLYFLEPYLRRVQLNESTRLLYKGTVRMLLVLLHDFPEFLCDYHFSFCDIMPIPCVQIRNLILSAFPRNMKLPDPFMQSLKVDLLPEIKVAPRILANYTTTLLQLNLKADVDSYMRTREERLLETIKDKLRLPKRETLQLDTKYNVPLLNALLLYVGVHLPQHGKTLPGQGMQQNNPSLEIFTYLAHNFDYEGRYLFLGAIANHLRYPNTHTHYFSCVLLYLFADTGDEVVREQITRVLLERLIVHRPHPWGLLITFIELIKNRRYEFWNHSFVKCAPEVEKLFQSVAYTCLGTTIDRQSEGEQTVA